MGTEAEVIVVGSGPAGTAAVLDLVRAGHDVLWLDRLPGARPKPCAGGLTPKAAARLRADVSPVVRERTPVIRMSWRGYRASDFRGSDDVCLLTHRPELDDWHRGLACAAGAVITPVRRLLRLRQDTQGVSLTVLDERDTVCTWRARWLIAADGAHSPVRRLVLGQGAVPVAVALEGLLARDVCRRWPGMQFDFGEVAGGYGWLFPKGDHVNVGLYCWHPGVTLGQPQLLDYARRTLGSDALTDIQGYPIATHGDQLPLSAGRVLFAGDAAGLAEPLLGEGIYGALLSGQQAAAAVLNEDAASVYARQMARWRLELRHTRQITRLFYGTLPLAFGVLTHLLKSPLMEGAAAGLTLVQSKRRWLTAAAARASSPACSQTSGGRRD
ncbi:hypothetical protein A167_01971 [Alcanivorax sp. S71-1-4]|uniref:FAD-dependent monooxygenase n=1 Tax=Alcanivorax sp. S71-1-4 TaxID=1177159 RepID=UPI00135CDA66|nr:NAD(P)/FAD-dependent oxidoreductase [Alcanivorax sp. S71-1-4]KAF0809210.1 hypothetical protein A167_01971 [Alcanivorax sp. S71-1-4]